jgi:hypothetical protein
MGAKVRAYDPVGLEQANQVLTNVTYCRPYGCVEDADAVVIVTEREQVRALDLARVSNLRACPVTSICAMSIGRSTVFAYACRPRIHPSGRCFYIPYAQADVATAALAAPGTAGTVP